MSQKRIFKHSSLLCVAVLALLWSRPTKAAPLGTFPTAEEGRARFQLMAISDIWTKADQDKESPVRIFNGTFIVPFLKTEKWTASFSSSQEVLGFGFPHMAAGQEQVEIGPNLRDQNYFLGAQRTFKDGSYLATFAGYGSASDDPFTQERNNFRRFGFAYQRPLNELVHWIIGADYNQNRGFLNNSTMPLFGLQFEASDEVRITAGFPFFVVNWNDYGRKMALLRITTVGAHGEMYVRVTDVFYAGMRGGFSTRAYAHVNRTEKEMRLFYQENYVDMGFKTTVTDETSVALAVGYSSQRSFYEGKEAFQPIGPRNKLPSDIYGGMIWEFNL